MRVFVTGATGFIGTQVTADLLAAGHQVLGLTRSDSGAAKLKSAGAKPHFGSLEDLESLRRGAAASDAVIHLAFNHDFSNIAQICETDRAVIEAMGAVLAGSSRKLLFASPTAVAFTPGRASTEDDPPNAQNPRIASEHAAEALQAKGVHAIAIRIPQVHDPIKQGLVSYLAGIAREKGISAYVGEGANRWPAVHVRDAARLFRLALENGQAGLRYHAVAEEGVTLKDIAMALGKGLGVPVTSKTAEEAEAYFGWFGMFVAADIPASGRLTQQRLGWQPSGPTLLADLAEAKF